MKESLARIVAWAKKHPYIAGAIVVGVVALAYIASKRGGSGGGDSMSYDIDNETNESQSPPSADLALGTSTGGGGDTSESGSSGGDSGGNGSGSSGGGDGGSSGGFGGGGDGGFAGFDPIPAYSFGGDSSYAMAEGAPVTSKSFGSFEDKVTPKSQPVKVESPLKNNPNMIRAGAPGAMIVGNKVVRQEKTTPPVKKQVTVKNVPVKITSPLANNPNMVRQGAKPVTATSGNKGTAQPVQGVKGSAIEARPKPITTPALTRPQPKPATVRTHAERVGKPKYFTGLYKGKVYVAGWIPGQAR